MSKASKIKLYTKSAGLNEIEALTGWTAMEIVKEIESQMLDTLENSIHHIGLLLYRGCPWYDNLIKANGRYYTITDKSTGKMDLTWFNGNETDYKRMCL